MYRIHFDPATGKFIIQIGRYGGLCWVTVCKEIVNMSEPIHCPLEFSTYRDACLHVDSIGLSALYDDRSENMRRKFLAAA